MKHAGLCLGVLLVLAAGPAVADADWIGAGTGGVTATDPADPATWWENPDNWAAGQVPVSSDVARLPFSNAGAVYADAGGAEGICVDGPATDAALYFGEGADFVVGRTMYLGYEANGRAVQTGGTVMIEEALKIASGPLRSSGSSGTYELHGGSLTVGARSVISRLDVYLGHMGAGTFIQTGGVHTVTNNLKIALEPGSAGTYLLSGGELTVGRTESVGTLGTGVFTQTGGTHTVSGKLYVATNDMGSGTYELAGGTLAAKDLRIGFMGPGLVQQTGGSATAELCRVEGLGRYEMAGGAFAAQRLTLTGLFDQTGGSSTIGCIEILPSGRLLYTGGTLEPDGLWLGGVLDLGGAEVTLSLEASVIELDGGRIENAERATLALDGAMLVVAPGFDPATVFGACAAAATIHTPGQALVIEAGQERRLRGRFRDAVETAGSLVAPDGSNLELCGRLTITGGRVDLGGGVLHTFGRDGRMSGGVLCSGEVRVEDESVFTQTAGTHTVAGDFRAGIGPSGFYRRGTYVLAGGDLEVMGDENLGETSGADFRQTKGFHRVHGTLRIDDGTYVLSEGELAVGGDERLAPVHDATFDQPGGVHRVNGDLCLVALCTGGGSKGAYTLSGGELYVVGDEYIGFDCKPRGGAVGSLRQSAGVHTVDGRLVIGRHGNYQQLGGHSAFGSLYIEGESSIEAPRSDRWIGSFWLSDGIAEVSGTAEIAGQLSLKSYRDIGVLLIGDGDQADWANLATPAFVIAGGVSLAGGEVTAGQIRIGGSDGGRLQGHGRAAGNVCGDPGSQIVASGGPLELGNETDSAGFATQGYLHVGAEHVTLLDAGTATLDGMTTLEGGILSAANGLVLGESGRLEGWGVVDGDFTNYGYVFGNGPALADILEFTGYVTGTGVFDGAVVFSGVFDPTGGGGGPDPDPGEVPGGGEPGGGDPGTGGTGEVPGGSEPGGGDPGGGSTPGIPEPGGGDPGGGDPGIGGPGEVPGGGDPGGGDPGGGSGGSGGSFIDDVVFEPSATIIFDLGQLLGDSGDATAASGSGAGPIHVGGSAFLGGTLVVTIPADLVLAVGDCFRILEANAIVGEFDGLDLPELRDGLSWDTSALYTRGDLRVMPEPATLALLVVGGLVLAAGRRRRHA